jgi:RIO-like serine/threonine protein kinase
MNLEEKYPPTLYFIKENVTESEYLLHKYVYKLEIVNVPKIYHYDRETQRMVMQRLGGMTLSDMYGAEESCIDAEKFEKVRNIVQLLFNNNIEYPDITGYNFIEYNGKMWVIDFGDARYIARRIKNPFILQFLGGRNRWNPQFL